MGGVERGGGGIIRQTDVNRFFGDQTYELEEVMLFKRRPDA